MTDAAPQPPTRRVTTYIIIHIAVIGAGLMVADHARIVAEDLPGAILQVVCDSDAARARRVADDLEARDVAINPEAVIARADVDAVIIASPDATSGMYWEQNTRRLPHRSPSGPTVWSPRSS
jgi:prephenate dehydrogenase